MFFLFYCACSLLLVACNLLLVYPLYLRGTSKLCSLIWQEEWQEHTWWLSVLQIRCLTQTALQAKLTLIVISILISNCNIQTIGLNSHWRLNCRDISGDHDPLFIVIAGHYNTKIVEMYITRIRRTKFQPDIMVHLNLIFTPDVLI